MNFLDAHKIVSKYIDTVVDATNKTRKTNYLFRPISILHNSKDDIIDAFKLFYAHMIFFNTRSQAEYEQYEVVKNILNSFVDDETYSDSYRSFRIITSKNPFKKLRKNYDLIEQSFKKYSDEFVEGTLHSYRGIEVEEFFNAMLVKKDGIFNALNKVKEVSGNIPLVTYLRACNEYCLYAYEMADIKMNEDDIEFFYSFDQLRKFLNHPKLAYIYVGYEDYINSRQ